MRGFCLIARSVLIEAVRRREVYAVALLACLMIGGVMSIDFFGIRGLSKFYREVGLSIMSAATALTVVVLATRQLPREFERRTIYPLLARPIGRFTFLSGKLAGVMLAAAFSLALFMVIFIAGTAWLGGNIPWMHLVQYMALQLMQMLILATLGFFLSMVFNLDAAMTLGVLFYFLASTFTSVTTYLYDYNGLAGRVVLRALTWLLPQLVVFDLGEKTVHAESWPPLGWGVMGALALYAAAYAAIFFTAGYLRFRRRPL